MWFIRINMTDRKYQVTKAPEKYKLLAGRGLTSNLVADEVPPLCHPLGPNNKLVFSPGFTTGTTAPTSSRISVGGKSPLTGGIKEANAGTSWAAHLASMQIKALIVEGQPKEKDKYWGALLTWDKEEGKPKIEWFEADKYTKQDVYKVFPEIYSKFEDRRISVCGTGVAGELGYSNSGIVFSDMSDRPSRYAGRGGLGAVMASKGLNSLSSTARMPPGWKLLTRRFLKLAARK